MSAAPSGSPQNIWAIPVRLAHWSLAALVLFNIFNDSGAKLHRYAGYTAVAVVVLRLAYALAHRAGPAGLHVPTPVQGWRHLQAMLRGNVPRPAGHNPLGAAMTLVLWTLVLLLGLSGWISRWDMFWGEDWPQDVHSWLSWTIQGCVLLHLGGVVASSLLERQNLAWAMITGRKRIDDDDPA